MSNLLKKFQGREVGTPGAHTQAGAVAERMREDQLDRDAVVLLCTQIEVGDQARKTFEGIEELAADIKTKGQLQPIIVTELGPYRFKLAYGERRLRAIRDVLGQDTILARIKRDLADATALRLSQLSENIHRHGYKPFELAEEFASLMEDNGWDQDELAAKVNVSKSWVSKRLSLLKAPPEIQAAIRSGELAETDYYNNKDAVKAEVATKRQKPDGSEGGEAKATPKTVALPWSNAVELAELVVTLAERAGLRDVALSPEPTKKELVALLGRVGDVRGAA